MWQRPSVSSELEPFCQVESVLPISSIMAYVFFFTDGKLDVFDLSFEF